MMRTLALALLTILLLISSPLSTAAEYPTLVMSDGLMSDAERASVQRDADLAQRSGVPIMFAILRTDGTAVASAQEVADDYRANRGVETEPGADDGIVFVVAYVENNPQLSTAQYSAGANAFSTTGLSRETIDEYLNEFVMPLLHEGRLFDASSFLMRLTRHTSLYVPPPPRAIEGVAKITQQALMVIAPLAAIGTIALLATQQSPSTSRRWRIVIGTLVGAAVLFGLSVFAHSRIGVVSMAILLLALAVWCLWVTRDREQARLDVKSILPDIAIALVLIAVSLAVNMRQVELTPGDRDETRWLNRAYYAVDLADPFGPTWQDYITTVGQPPLGSIAIGIGLLLQGHDVHSVGVWDYQYDRAWYTATGGYPTDDTLHAGRRTNAVIGALATGAAFVLGRLLTNRIGGIAAGLYLAWHPLHIVLSTQALSDETFALLLLLALIAAWMFADKPTWARSIALGILLGLGGATKLTPLLLAPPLAVYGLVRLWLDKGPDGKRAGAMLIAQPFIAFATFVAIYPWLWENPIGRAWRLFAFRSSEMDAQTSAWPNALTDTPLHALARFGDKLTYTHSTSQKAMQAVYDWAGIERTAVGIDLVLAAAGIVILLWGVARYGIWTPRAMVAMLMLGEIALLAIGMKADFYRYHLPVVMIVSGLISVSIGDAWQLLRALLPSRLTAPETPLEVAE